MRNQNWSVRMADATMQRFPVLGVDWNYHWGVVLTGIEQVWHATEDEKYFAYIQRNIDRFVQPDGTIYGYQVDEYNLDHLNTGKVLFPLYERTRDPKYKRALELLRLQLDTQPRTKSGGFWHKQIYPYQMWVDGLYMGSAFWAQYASTFGEQRAFSAIAHQFSLIEQHTRDPKTGLLYHAWDESKQQGWASPDTGCSPHFWGRAIGWYVMALVDVLDDFPREHPARGGLIKILQRAAEALAHVQDDSTGLWYQILDQPHRPGNYREASVSCMVTYALAKGARLGYLDQRYCEIARRAYDGIVAHFVQVDAQGSVHLNWTCGSAGLGGTPYRDGSFEYYVGEKIITDDHKGVGAFILASVELEKES